MHLSTLVFHGLQQATCEKGLFKAKGKFSKGKIIQTFSQNRVTKTTHTEQTGIPKLDSTLKSVLLGLLDSKLCSRKYNGAHSMQLAQQTS